MIYFWHIDAFLILNIAPFSFRRVFDTFQYCSLNKRLLYVLWEGILELLFPNNKFNDIFLKIHAKPKTWRQCGRILPVIRGTVDNRTSGHGANSSRQQLLRCSRHILKKKSGEQAVSIFQLQ